MFLRSLRRLLCHEPVDSSMDRTAAFSAGVGESLLPGFVLDPPESLPDDVLSRSVFELTCTGMEPSPCRDSGATGGLYSMTMLRRLMSE